MAHLLRIVSQRETAEDLCQETFVKALRAWEQQNPPANVQAWLFRIATNTAYDYLRRQRRIRFLALDASPPPSVDDHELATRLDAASAVARAFRRLSPHQRVLLLQHYYADRSIPDIAALLECRQATINTRLFRARAQLRKVLQPHAMREE